MKLTIGDVDHTKALQEGTLVLRQYGTLRSNVRATLNFQEIPANFPKAGQEIILWEDESIVWGGIVVETEEVCHSTQSFTITLRGQGYEQILQRYELPGMKLSAMPPSQAAEHIFKLRHLRFERGVYRLCFIRGERRCLHQLVYVQSVSRG